MSDNVNVTPGSGNVVAADEVVDGTLGTVKVQYVKLMDGTLDGTTKASVGANGLKVDGSAVTQPVSGTFFQATQPISGTVAVSNFPADQLVSIDRSGRTPVLKTGTLVTTATTADQVILTYTVTVGKTFWLLYIAWDARLTVLSATASILGAISLETPSGTKVFTSTETNPTTSETLMSVLTFPEALPIPAGTTIRWAVTPNANTSMTWIANFGGYES